MFTLTFFNLTTAQYTINWQEAPLNKIPLKYKLEHYNLKGPMKEYALMGKDFFDKQGYLIRGYKGISYEFTYDSNHKPLVYKHWLSESFIMTDQLILDEKGRIIKADGSTGEKYIYDKNGNWTETIDISTGTRKNGRYIYSYDNKNRLIKEEYLSTTILWEDRHTYAKDGDYVLITTTRQDFQNPSKNFKKSNYYKNGTFYGAVKNDNVKYDKYGNIAKAVDATGKTATLNLTSYVYYGDPGVSDTIDFTFDKKEKTVNKENPNCIEGDCLNDYGTYNFDNGTYTGFFKDGKMDGFGMFRWKTGDSFVGLWKNNASDGYGLYTAKAGGTQQGTFKNGSLNGLGTKIFADGTAEYGIYKDGNLITKYNYYSTKKTKDCLAGDCYNGYGKFLFDNGGMFVGFFKNGYMQQGVWRSADGDTYTGSYGANNKMEGYGHYKFKNKDNYFGEYKEGKRNGRGVYYIPSTQVSKIGEWENGKLIINYKK